MSQQPLLAGWVLQPHHLDSIYWTSFNQVFLEHCSLLSPSLFPSLGEEKKKKRRGGEKKGKEKKREEKNGKKGQESRIKHVSANISYKLGRIWHLAWMKFEKFMWSIVESHLVEFAKLKGRMPWMATLPHFFYLVTLITEEAPLPFPCTYCLR